MPDRLSVTDDYLNDVVTRPAHYDATYRAIAAELIERRAADSAFAAGAELYAGIDMKRVCLFVGPDPRTPGYFVVACPDGGYAHWRAADLTLVPAKPTAAEVFAEEHGKTIASRRLTYSSRVEANDAFRATCERMGIDPDAPLVTDSEVAS